MDESIILVCESCGRMVHEDESIRASFDPDGCDHYYRDPDDERVAWVREALAERKALVMSL